MTPQKYKLAAELFHRVREIPSQDRQSALDMACKGDTELLQQVLDLLESDEAAGASFMGRTAIQDAADLIGGAAGPEPFHPADVIAGRYQIAGRIGAGGMGVVYKAEDLRLQRPVAIKVLRVGDTSGARERVRRFQQEARAASHLNHPNIVAMHDSGTEAGLPFFAMEYVEGQTLRAMIIEEKQADIKLVFDVISQAASALSAVHAAGIIHRDIKPENIVVRPDGFVKVLDFGLARMREPGSDESIKTLLTRAGQVAGTVQYLSPEQILGKPVTARTDLFSLGVVAYELATGVRPFDGPTDGAVFDAILRRDPEPPSAVRPELGRRLDALIMGAIEKDPDLRFQTAADLRSACRRAERSLTTGSGDDKTPRPTAVAWGFRWRPRMLGIAAVLAAVAFLLYQNRSLPDPKVSRNLQITSGPPVNSFVNDGARLYYSAGRFDSNPPLLEVSTNGGSAQEIPNLRGMLPFDMSRDHGQLLLGKVGSTRVHAVWVASVLGNGLRRVGGVMARYAHWSSRGDKIVFTTGKDVTVANADGSNARRLFELHNDGHVDGPIFLNGDREICFGTAEQNLNFVWEVNADGSSLHQVMPNWPEATLRTGAAISDDGKYFLFIAGRNGIDWDLWGLRLNSSLFRWRKPEPFRLTAGPLSAYSPQFSPSGRRVFYVGDSLQSELVRFDPASHNWVAFLRGINAFQLEFSKDGEWITYVAPPGLSVWRSRADGSETIQLTAPPLNAINPRLSPDNSRVVFWGSVPGQTPGMFMVSANGGAVEALTETGKGAASEQEPSWSPDGQSVLYGSNGSLWIMDVAARKAIRLPRSDGLHFPRWSPDGKYGVAADAQSRLWLYDVVAHRSILLTTMGAGYPAWSRDGKYVYFENDACSIWYRIGIADHEPVEVANMSGLQMPATGLGWVGVTPHGEIISARDTSTKQIYAMDWDPR